MIRVIRVIRVIRLMHFCPQQRRVALLPSGGARPVGEARASAEELLAESRTLYELRGVRVDEDGGIGGLGGAASAIGAAASAFEFARKQVHDLVVPGTTPDDNKLLLAVEVRRKAAERLFDVATRVQQLLGPSAEQRVQLLAQITPVLERVGKLLARLPAPELELGPVATPSCDLPALAEGAGSATATLEQAYTVFQAAWKLEAELALSLSGHRGLWQPLDGEACARLEQAACARGVQGRSLVPLMRSVETELRAGEQRTVAMAHALAAWCRQEVEERTFELTQQASQADHMLTRTRALLARAQALLQAQVCF